MNLPSTEPPSSPDFSHLDQSLHSLASSRWPARIGLCGLAGSGKDTVGALLSMLGYTPLSLAYELRKEIETHAQQSLTPFEMLFSLPPKHPAREGYYEVLTKPNRIWLKPTPPNIRALLQWWGTDWRRNSNLSHWIDLLRSNPLWNNPYVVITDIRYPNEQSSLLGLRDHLWHILNPTLPVSPHHSHSSETELQSLNPTHTVLNDSTHYRLVDQIKLILEKGKLTP